MNGMTQLVTKIVMSLYSVILLIFTYIIQDIFIIIDCDIVIVTNYLENKNNKITTQCFGSGYLESCNNQFT